MAVELTTTDEKVLAKLAELSERHGQIEQQMHDPAVAGNPTEFTKLAKEHGRLGDMVQGYRQDQGLQKQLEEAEHLFADEESEAELKELAKQEIDTLRPQMQEALSQIKEMLVMSDDAAIG